jgi:hypothetical protein
VYERQLEDMAVLALENTDLPYVQWMLKVPTIFTKEVTPKLADQLASLPFHPTLDDLIFIIEAYPASSHKAAVPELGIIISVNHSFRVNEKNLQRNWMYDHCYVVDRNGRTRWLLKHLPKQARHERDPK